MLKLPSLGEMDHAAGVRIFLCTRLTDMRCGFDRLAALVRDAMGRDPLDGSLFLFRSRGGDRLKILYWDRDGFALWYKRLEQATFRLPRPPADGSVALEMRWSELAMLLEGIDLRSIKRRPRLVLQK